LFSILNYIVDGFSCLNLITGAAVGKARWLFGFVFGPRSWRRSAKATSLFYWGRTNPDSKQEVRKMTEKIRFLKEKGKYVSKDDLKFYSRATLEQIERAERNQKAFEFAWLDDLDKRGEIDPDNPPAIWAITFQRWLLRRYGLRWVVDYLKRREYKDNPEGIPGRLQALDVSKADIQALDKPIAVKVAGVSFGNRQKALERLTYYAPEEILTVLVPEPENPYDPDAISVQVLVAGAEKPYCLGYIPRTETQKVKPVIWRIPELKIHQGETYSAELRIAVEQESGTQRELSVEEAQQVIREALKDWERPCHECEHKKNGYCTKWECVVEQQRIAEALEAARHEH
jgi:hypothetical protein